MKDDSICGMKGKDKSVVDTLSSKLSLSTSMAKDDDDDEERKSDGKIY